MRVQKLVLCEFHCKPWPSGLSLESPGLENIPQVPGKRAEVAQNHDARNAHPDFEELRLDLPELRGYIPVLRTLN